MQASAETRRQQGFTLLEIMVTVGLIGITILPILQVREEATNRAWRTAQMLRALHHAQELLAEYGREIRQMDKFESRVEEEPVFRYVITFEDWDLSTGRPEDELEDDDLLDDNPTGSIVPPDAGVLEEDVRDDPHRVRRFRIKIFWPDVNDFENEDAEEELMIEGFLPRMWEEQSDTFDNPAPR